MNINVQIERLINYGLKKGLLGKWDVLVARNFILDILGLSEFEAVIIKDEDLDTPTEILDEILDWAYENKVLEENTVTYRELLDTKIMACLTPRQSEVVDKFYSLAEKEGIKASTEYYYKLSKASNYIRTESVAKNLHWYAYTEYGELEITINLSKPEKDPKAIAAARNMKQSSYPKCLLCKENAGYAGRINHPARQTHRIIPLELRNEQWYLQYSPYVYYNEHSIIFSGEHVPMKISKKSFDMLLEFTEKFPHYFIGSNADLPIVGGSILTHDHFQGGNYEFAMAKAPVETKVNFDKYPGVGAGIVKWPMSVIRMRSKDRAELSELGDEILEKWRAYTDESLGIFAKTDEPHNTVTPIARRRGEYFELDLVLRNNRTSEEHPLGIFHPHSEVHNIKKENIGLIEVMGLAVLPGRLKEELKTLGEALVKEDYIEEIEKDEEIVKHLNWAKLIKEKYSELDRKNVNEVLKKEVALVFSKVLEDAGVYKRDEQGKLGFLRFIESVNK
ncbi:UDP-glucose--hexose-1-phosphate uridylyltransferase [uncultured Ilyobacter sp.]|uniref:UDP-glucose--hexose-1-phosphate uridylyltransferase n=1 Tax=uncultured Ilyobacter sp. TaxID=544433 RepID=UPI002AA6AC42|nr:UDP-glucose--hexose-1-phosphate uridylyltransferase [uncultured Ilyobacter sp.]